MRTDRIKLGVVGGIVGGMAMAMWMMLYYLATNRGFWKPVGYIGHVVLRTGSVTAAGPIVAGVVIHMMMSMVLGALIAQVLPADRLLSVAVGVTFPSAPGVHLVLPVPPSRLNGFSPPGSPGLHAVRFP